MAFQVVFTYLSLLLLSAFALAAPTNCMNPVRVITVRGSFEVLGESCLRDVFSAVQGMGANGVLQGTPYPAMLDAANPQGDQGVYDNSVTVGVSSLKSIIEGAVGQCPNQKIVLVGYSQGANVIMDSLCSPLVSKLPILDHGYANNIKAVVLFGDPTHNSGQSFSAGGAYTSGNVARWDNMQCDPYTNKIVSYCHAGDPFCASGGDLSQHLNYMPGMASEAAQFIMSKV